MDNRSTPKNDLLKEAQHEAELLRASERLYAMHPAIEDELARARFRENHPDFVPKRSKSLPIKQPKMVLYMHAASGQSYFAPKRKLSKAEKASSITASNPTDSFSSQSPLDDVIGKPHPRLAHKK